MLLLMCALLALSTPVAAADPSSLIAGKRIAERNCGSCHAVADGVSPNPDAPPFRTVHRRYRDGGLATLLAEGMIAPVDPEEEVDRIIHPRMPGAKLDEDEIRLLAEYMRSLEPRRGASGKSRR